MTKYLHNTKVAGIESYDTYLQEEAKMQPGESFRDGDSHMNPNMKKLLEKLGGEVAPDDHPIWSTGPIITSMRHFMNPLSQNTQKPTAEKTEPSQSKKAQKTTS